MTHPFSSSNKPPFFLFSVSLGSTDIIEILPGVIKAIHSSFREKRCKEIRKWLKQHPKITHFCAIDDVDLSMPDKKSGRDAEQIFLDPDKEFVKTSLRFLP